MIRKHENAVAKKAGALSLLVHGGLLLLLVLSVNFKSSPPVSYSEVELWDTLPNQTSVKIKPIKIEEPIPETVQEVKIEEPIIEKPVLQDPPEIKIKDEIKKPKPVEEKPVKPKVEKVKPELDPLKALQDEMASEDNKVEVATKKVEKPRISTANQGEIDKYRALIAEKIKDKVNKDLCDIGSKKVTVKISLLITGEVSGAPRVVSGSGVEACDQAIESAVLLAQPLPLPADKELFAPFRDLTLNFRPNE